MTKDIMNSIRELETIQETAGKAFPMKNAAGDTEPSWQYNGAAEDGDADGIPASRARTDRAAMLRVLTSFYDTHQDDDAALDDFVTLVGAYCTLSIRWNMHQALPEDETFGLASLYDHIADEDMTTCLRLIQDGIYHGRIQPMEQAAKRFPYSLPHLYLFLDAALHYKDVPTQERYWEQRMVRSLSKMQPSLRAYVLGTSKALREDGAQGFTKMDPNPLPYVVFGDRFKEYKARMADELYRHLRTIRTIEGALLDLDTDAPEEAVSDEDGMRMTEAQYRVDFCIDEMSALYPDLPIDIPEESPYHDIDMSALTLEDCRDHASIFLRLEFLRIPCKIDWGDDAFAQMMNSMAERQRVVSEKNEIVQDFTHTYKNLKATNLYHIAQTLLARKTPEEQKLGRDILLEYSRKVTMTKDVYMMQLKYEHNTEHLRRLLQESCTFALPGMSSNGNHVPDLIDQALMTCLINIFYDPSHKDMRIHFCYAIPKEVKALYMEFEQDVLQGKRSCLDLLNDHGLKIAFSMTPEWELLSFQPDEYAEIFLKDILVELLANFFLQGAVTAPIHLDFAADEQSFHLSVTNEMSAPLPKDASIRVGMRSIDRMLSVLWNDLPATPQPHIELSEEDKTFHVQLYLPHILAAGAREEEPPNE